MYDELTQAGLTVPPPFSYLSNRHFTLREVALARAHGKVGALRVDSTTVSILQILNPEDHPPLVRRALHHGVVTQCM